MSVILLSTLSMQGMDKDYAQLANRSTDKVEKYNEDEYLLTSFPDETLIEIFSYCIANDKDTTSLENSINTFMALRTTCKRLNALLTFEIIGNFYDPYTKHLDLLSRNCKTKILKNLKHKQIASRAERYNDTDCLLTKLPDNTLINVCSYCLSKHKDHVTLQSDIKNFMKLSTACKKFNSLLTHKTIGSLCEPHTHLDKNMFLAELIKTMKRYIFSNVGEEMPALILICAGADPNQMFDSRTIIEAAIRKSYGQLITTLLEHNANPDITPYGTPIFFHAQTAKIAQMLIDKGVNVRVTNKDGDNVLWQIMNDDDYSAELLELYITRGVDASTFFSHRCYRCLLHKLASPYRIINIDDFYKKGVLLLNAIPHMINALNYQGQTPLDVAQETYKKMKAAGSITIADALLRLITLFIERDGLTAQGLAQKKNNHNSSINERLSHEKTNF